MPPTEAQRAANKRQDATRKRVALFLDPPTAQALDALRGDIPRVAYVRALIEKQRRKSK